MEKQVDLSETICSLLLEKAGDQPIILLEIGPTLIVDAKYSQEQVMNALYWLVDARRIELMSGNRVR